MRFSVTHLLLFTLLVSVQIRFLQLQWLGLGISGLAIPISMIGIVVSVLTSESKNGMLAVGENPTLRIWKRVFWLSILNFVIVILLSAAFTWYQAVNHSPYSSW